MPMPAACIGAMKAPRSTCARQHDLEHVPVAVLEILERQLAAERAIEALEIAARQRAAPRVELLQPRELAEADARRDVGHVVLAAGQRRVQSPSAKRSTPCRRHSSQRRASSASLSTRQPPSAVVMFLLA